MKNTNQWRWVAGALLLAAAPLVQAQSTGSLLVRGGFTQISPDVSSGNLTAPSFANTKVDVLSDTQLSGGITYMLTDHWAVDVPLALPFKHDTVGAGAIAGVGKIGEVKALPVTIFAQYRFLEPQAKIRPYVGLGLTYAKFYKERGTAALNGLTGGTPAHPTLLSAESKLGLTPQVGVSIALNDRWFVDLAYYKTFVKTRNTLSTGQHIDIKLNPDVFAIGVGYRF
ncbi:MAG: OmpW family outer membrane protein [Giesbergeria sp.]